MTRDLHLVDAFAEDPFTGNPAAVVLLEDKPSDEWMQNVAMEMNQAETAFLHWDNAAWSLRWFTPMSEVDLCGHATMGSAHFLWSEGHASTEHPILFQTRSGVLAAERGKSGEIILDFPQIRSAPVEPPDDLVAAIGMVPTGVYQGDFDLLCVLESPEQVMRAEPDLGIISKWNVRGLILTARADDPNVDFICRCFYPGLGIPEDPATGSAYCAIAPYWQGVLKKDRLVGFQASRRGGMVGCELVGDRVRLSGKARTTLRGQLDA